MIIENLTTLKINQLTQAQYEAALAAGTVNENELYMTPESEVGSDVFIATYGVTTNAEIEAAYQAGKEILARKEKTFINLRMSYRQSGSVHVFTSLNVASAYFDAKIATIIAWRCKNDVWENIVINNGLPPVTADDNGKILQVVNGVWTAVDDTPTVSTTTLLASGWDAETKTYSFESTYPNANYDIEVALDSTATTAQAEAFNGAQIVGSATSNIIKAYGDVPTVDIPVILKVVTK